MQALNFGNIDTKWNVYFTLNYNAPGAGAMVTCPGDTIMRIALSIKQTATGNIAYLQNYIDWIHQGMFVGKAKYSWFMAFPTAQQVIDACNAFQGGFVKMWTADEIIAMQTPYKMMLWDYSTISVFVKANTK